MKRIRREERRKKKMDITYNNILQLIVLVIFLWAGVSLFRNREGVDLNGVNNQRHANDIYESSTDDSGDSDSSFSTNYDYEYDYLNNNS